ncbi:hypothetical protein CS022_08870 [Veronia nyctiphanis]|uniref:DUF2989 domain-containing protein n=1 Tax=Veronia nyctiphanis TaxID=1278244 RepID=A0A4V1LT13_9GAMM|nr:DUF2989 domain-containing protein [Veronia nyctiphanis]RXJ73598.1 hypothetical protein CS022_08870 [Veronia nyctiphanis]
MREHDKGIYRSNYKCVVLLLLFAVAACTDNHRSTTQLCNANTELCEKLNMNDNQCKDERMALIWQRLESKENPKDMVKFAELKLTKIYIRCMTVSAQIQTTTLKEKLSKRSVALFHAKDSEGRLEKELQESPLPEIILYRWSQGDQKALEQYLRLEDTPYLDSTELQLGLASYYVDKDKAHAAYILVKALTFYDGEPGEERDKSVPEAIKSLATNYHALGKIENAYFWAMVGNYLDLPVAGPKKLEFMYPMEPETRDTLDELANEVSKSINSGSFTFSMVEHFTEEE